MKKEYHFNKREIYSYSITGIFLASINYTLFYVVQAIFKDYVLANIISIVTVRVLAYIMHKFYVYKSYTRGLKQTLFEFGRFMYVRTITGFLDFVIVALMVEQGEMTAYVSKMFSMLIVVICNYFLGKILVFKGGK